MLINYFDKYKIDTDNLKEKLDIISNYDSENASFISHIFENTINYLFKEEKLNANNNLSHDFPINNNNTIIIYFDNYVENNENEDILKLENNCKCLIIIGNHKTIHLNKKVELVNIKHVSNIKKLIKDSKIKIGFNADAIDNDSYYYGRMRNFFLNFINNLEKIPIEALKRDVEGTCSSILLNEENFKSYHLIENDLIKMRKLVKTYDFIVNTLTNKDMVNKEVFYIGSDYDNQRISLLNSLSELFELYYNKGKKERFSYAYDKICNQMLEEAKNINYCYFLNNECITSRYTCNSFPNSKENGCCNNTYKDRNKDCRYLKDDCSCSICSIACRVFTCGYLQKRGIDHSLWQYPLIDCVFSKLARPKIIYGFFTPKDEMMKRF